MPACVDLITVNNCTGFPGDLIDRQFNTKILNGGPSLLVVTLFG